MLKRLFDLLFSLTLSIILLPLIVFLALLVRIIHGNPLFFVQERPGLNGKIFRMYKFRTMTSACGGDGKLLADQYRLTAFGKFLRSSSLDELPELLNVIRGDMSIVGPRPLLVDYLQRYNQDQLRRHEVKPGITGWAQINGRNAITWEDKFALDVWYVDNHSLWLDLKIIGITLKKVIGREDINQSGHVTAQAFMGSERNKSKIY